MKRMRADLLIFVSMCADLYIRILYISAMDVDVKMGSLSLGGALCGVEGPALTSPELTCWLLVPSQGTHVLPVGTLSRSVAAAAGHAEFAALDEIAGAIAPTAAEEPVVKQYPRVNQAHDLNQILEERDACGVSPFG